MVAACGDGIGFIMPRAASTLAKRLAQCAPHPPLQVMLAGLLVWTGRRCMCLHLENSLLATCCMLCHGGKAPAWTSLCLR